MPRDVFFLNPRTETLRHFKLRYFVLRFARSDTPVDDVIPEQNDDEREAGVGLRKKTLAASLNIRARQFRPLGGLVGGNFRLPVG